MYNWRIRAEKKLEKNAPSISKLNENHEHATDNKNRDENNINFISENILKENMVE